MVHIPKALFIPGPTNVPQSLRLAMDIAMEDPRSADFPKFTLPLFEQLKKIFKTNTGRILLFPGSGTGGWEASLTNTLSPGDRVLVSRFGQFSTLWAKMCEQLHLDPVVLDVEWGEGVPLDLYAEQLTADKEHKIKAVLACQNETATGVTSDIAGVRRVLDEANHPALLMVDGVSSIGSIDFRMDEWGVDLAVCGAQKGFMLPTGLTIIGVSEKALAATKSAKLPRSYFDFDTMVAANKEGYFPYTPATTLLRGLKASCDLLLEEGLESVFARHHRLAEGVRRAVIDGWGLEVCAKGPQWYSNTVTAIRVPPEIDARKIIKMADSRYNLALGAGLAGLAGKVFRIGHLGMLNEVMLAQALVGSEMAMRDCGLLVEPGSGVAQAEEIWRNAYVSPAANSAVAAE